MPRHACPPLALAALLAAQPALAVPCPVSMPIHGELSSGFGLRHGRLHPGVDIRAPIGTQVRAASSGTVMFVGRYYDYGLMVEILHEDGSRARYAHLAGFARGIAVGSRVATNEPLGSLGRTGRTTGSNLHVELRREGRPVDPWPWLSGTTCPQPGESVAAIGSRRSR